MVHPPLRAFFISYFFSRYKKDFLPVPSKLSQASVVRIFYFSDKWKAVSVAPKEGCTPPPINPEVFFSDILATASGLSLCMDLKFNMCNKVKQIYHCKSFDAYPTFLTYL